MTIYYCDLPEDIQEVYSDLDDESKKYPLEWVGSVIRFKRNESAAIQYALDHVNLNAMWTEAIKSRWPVQDMMMFYRMMGYSLCGFTEVFSNNLAHPLEPLLMRN